MQMKKLLAMKPLRMLDDARQAMPLCISYYLREMYLRKNLGMVYEQNKIVYKDINNEYLHEYLIHLMAEGLPFTKIFAHESSLHE